MFIKNVYIKKWISLFVVGCIMILNLDIHMLMISYAAPEVSAPSVILMEASTGTIMYEKGSKIRRSPASITKIMTLLITMEELEKGKIHLTDEVLVSEYASSMGGSQVYLAQGEIQTLDTMIKCIVISSGNDASVAVAEHIAGSEKAFVDCMNQKALELGMLDSHFVDCCGLTDSDEHYTTAYDIAIMSRELITKYPKIYEYTGIWMDTIIHKTKQGESEFGLSSTNKLLKQYQYTTGLKTGSTSKAKYCISATAHKEDLDMIAVVCGAETPKLRFLEAKALLTYGFSNCKLYTDTPREPLPVVEIKNGFPRNVECDYEGEFRYVDTQGTDFDGIEKEIIIFENNRAPMNKGDSVGELRYISNGKILGGVNIVMLQDVKKASIVDFYAYMMKKFVL